MEAIIKYRANDGTEFTSEEKCLQHDELDLACKDAMASLPPSIKLEHGTYIQQDRESCLAAKRAIVAIALKRIDPNRTFVPKLHELNPEEIHSFSILGRIIDDSDVKPLSRAWGRIQRINWDNFCEYDQPYFALHPEEAEPA